MNKNSRIFIAGHKGLVGSAVYRSLLKKGYKKLYVVSKSKLDLKDSKKVEIYLIHCLVQWKFKLIKLLKLRFLKLPNCFDFHERAHHEPLNSL